MRSPTQPGGIFIFQFNRTSVVNLRRNISSFRTKIFRGAELILAAMRSKNFTRGSSVAVVKGAIHICTAWLLDLLILHMGKQHHIMVIYSKHIPYPGRETLPRPYNVYHTDGTIAESSKSHSTFLQC